MFLVEFLILCAVIPLLTGLCALYFSKRKNIPGTPAVLLFHSISTRQCTHFSHYPPEKFTLLMEELARQELRSVTLSNVVGCTGDSPGFGIIFDDGFESFYTCAFPEFEKNAMKATIFPIAGYVGKTSLWDILPRQRHMSRAQLREISDHGHEVGSHTLTHANLTYLGDRDVERELADSKRIIEDIIGKPVTSLSFPFGSWNKRVWEKAKEIGYERGTCYRHHDNIISGLLPVHGVYSFDSMRDVLDKVLFPDVFSNACARARIMSHFAKGTPLWKFRSNYAFFRWRD